MLFYALTIKILLILFIINILNQNNYLRSALIYLNQFLQVDTIFIYNSIMHAPLESPRSFSKNQRRLLLFVFLYVIPLFLIKSFPNKVLFGLILLLSVCTSFIFWISFVPIFQNNDGSLFNVLYTILLGLIQKAPSTFQIQSGNFDKDYFNIQSKPRLGSLLIDNTSAVIVINKKNEKRVLLPGFHFINHGEQVLHLFNFNASHYFWGRVDHKRFHAISNSMSNLDQNHMHSMNSSLTLGKTKDGYSVIPTFSIYFNFSHEQNAQQTETFFMELSDYFSAKNILGELDSHLKNLIASSITSVWQTFLKHTNAAELNSLSEKYISLAEKYIKEINIFLDVKTRENNVKLPNGQYAKLPESILFLKKLHVLNIRVYLESLWIEKHLD